MGIIKKYEKVSKATATNKRTGRLKKGFVFRNGSICKVVTTYKACSTAGRSLSQKGDGFSAKVLASGNCTSSTAKKRKAKKGAATLRKLHAEAKKLRKGNPKAKYSTLLKRAGKKVGK